MNRSSSVVALAVLALLLHGTSAEAARVSTTPTPKPLDSTPLKQIDSAITSFAGARGTTSDASTAAVSMSLDFP